MLERRDYQGPLYAQHPDLKMKKKNQHQVKTQYYYWFWAICAVAVVGGQVYVGSGYRLMTQELRSTPRLVLETACITP